MEVGPQVQHVQVGDRVTSIVTRNGYAEYDRRSKCCQPGSRRDLIRGSHDDTGPGRLRVLPLEIWSEPQTDRQRACSIGGGRGGTLPRHLAKGLWRSEGHCAREFDSKTRVAAKRGADFAVDYSDPKWPARVMDATHGKGFDVVLEAASGTVGKESLNLAAPFGQIAIYGAKNIHDTLSPETVHQLIYKIRLSAASICPVSLFSRLRKAFRIFLNSLTRRKYNRLQILLLPSPKRGPRFEPWTNAQLLARSCSFPGWQIEVHVLLRPLESGQVRRIQLTTSVPRCSSRRRVSRIS